MLYDASVTTTEREPLTRGRIIEAAMAFADENGLEALSMRKLGARLGVEAMSLYNHVDNKDDIYDGMIDCVFASIPLPDEDADWKDAIRSVGMAAMDAFTLHPWTVSLLMARGTSGPAALRFTDRIIGIFTNAGFSDEDAHHAWQMLASHTMGYAFQQIANPDPARHVLSHTVNPAEGEETEYPNLARLAPILECCVYMTEFAFGLEIIIDGLEARLR